MENFSEKEKPKRGRPKALSQEHELTLEKIGIFGDVSSRRSRLNYHYRQLALMGLGILDDDYSSEFNWLADPEVERNKPGRWKATILYELGRIEDDEAMREVARQICELKPKTRDAVAMIRRARIGKSSKAKTSQLLQELINTINSYMARHPDTTEQQIIDALEFTAIVVRDGDRA